MSRQRLGVLVAIFVALTLYFSFVGEEKQEERAERGEVTVAPKAPPKPAPRRLRFDRPDPVEPEPSQRTVASAPVQVATDAPTDRPVRSLDDLGDLREPFIQEALTNLQDVMAECEAELDGMSTRLRADARADERGLVSLELQAYDTDEEGRTIPSEEEVPEGFRDCVEDVLWEQPWMELPQDADVPFMLTFNVNQAAPVTDDDGFRKLPRPPAD